MRRLAVGFVSVLAIWLGVAGRPGADARAGAAGEFKTDGDAIEVDASVTDAGGQHVADLKVDDFEVFDEVSRRRYRRSPMWISR